MLVESGVVLFAFELLIATFKDWLATCQAMVPVVERLGVSMPAVTTKFEMTKQDIRNGRNTGSPVSEPQPVSTASLDTTMLEMDYPGVVSNPLSFLRSIAPASLTESGLACTAL